MARVIHIDRSFTPKHRSADADRVKPPEPGADPLEPKIQLAEMELVVPAGNAPAVSRKSRQGRQTRHDPQVPAIPPTKQPAAGNGQSRCLCRSSPVEGLFHESADHRFAGQWRFRCDIGGSSPRVFVRKPPPVAVPPAHR